MENQHFSAHRLMLSLGLYTKKARLIEHLLKKKTGKSEMQSWRIFTLHFTKNGKIKNQVSEKVTYIEPKAGQEGCNGLWGQEINRFSQLIHHKLDLSSL